MTLADVSTPADDHLEVAPGWRQGRGAYGGLVIGSLIRAIERAVADPRRRTRSVTAQLPGPTEVGRAELNVAILRAGSGMTTARAELVQAGEVRAHVVSIVATDRQVDAPAWMAMPRPDAPDWRTLAPAPWSPGYPEFAKHFEYRVVEGIPGTTSEPRALGWIKAREPGAVRDAGHIAAMADAWWPAALHRFSAMRPIATIAYTLDVIADPQTIDPELPLLYHAHVPVCGSGFFVELRTLWTEAGELVALNHQTFAVIK